MYLALVLLFVVLVAIIVFALIRFKKVNEQRVREANVRAQRAEQALSEHMDALQKSGEYRAIRCRITDIMSLRAHESHPRLFDDLHALLVTGEGPMRLSGLIDFFADSDLEWLEETYEKLFIDRLTQLIASARNGSTEAQDQILALSHDFETGMVFYGKDVFNELVADNFSADWDEFIIRCVDAPEWWELVGVDKLIESTGYRELFRNERDGDRLSMYYVHLLIREGDQCVKEYAADEYKKVIEGRLDALDAADQAIAIYRAIGR